MLIELHKSHLEMDPISRMIAQVNGNTPEVKELAVGFYQIGHFGSSSMLDDFNHYPEFENIGSYGVCDHFQQILNKCPELQQSTDRHFVVTLTPVVKANQSPDGGWRWHKWGEYIGTHDIKHEYLYDEEGIEQVFVFHIYEYADPSDPYAKKSLYDLHHMAMEVDADATRRSESWFRLPRSEARAGLIAIIKSKAN